MKRFLYGMALVCFLQMLSFVIHPVSQQLMAQKSLPLVYNVENTGAKFAEPNLLPSYQR